MTKRTTLKPQLLVITAGYPELSSHRYTCQFVAEITTLIAPLFSRVTVIAPQPFFPKLLAYVPGLRSLAAYANFQDYQTKNIRVFFPHFFTLPIPLFRHHRDTGFRQAILHTIAKERINFDFIHAHFLYPTGAILENLGTQFAKPIILSLHGGDVYEWPHLSASNLKRARQILRQAQNCVVPSTYLAQETRKILRRKNVKLWQIPPAIDTQLFRVRNRRTVQKKLGISPIGPVLLCVANLIPSKGQLELLTAYRQVMQGVPDAQLYFIGDGPLRTQLQTEILRWQLTHVHLVGGVTHTELPKWYAAADLLVFPSCEESFGIVQIEALACGIPVVVYDNPASHELLAHHSSLGKLVPCHQPQALAYTIVQSLNKTWKPNQLHSFVTTRYDHAVILRRWQKVYASLRQPV